MKTLGITAMLAVVGVIAYFAVEGTAFALEAKSAGEVVLTFINEHPQLTLPCIFILAFGESLPFVSLVLPFWAILVGVGTLLLGSGYELLPVLVAASFGAALGDWLSFWLGYHYHDRIAQTWPFTRYPDLLPRGHTFFNRWGFWAIWAARFSGPLRATVPIAAGAVQMNWFLFQIANWGSAFLWAYVLLKFPGWASGVWHYIASLF